MHATASCLAALALAAALSAASPALARPGRPAPLTTIPFSYERNEIILPVGVNGSAPMRFLLDSGAYKSAVDAARAKELRLSFEGHVVTQGAGATTTTGLLRGVTFNAPHLNLTVRGTVGALDLRGMRTDECDVGPRLDGILGIEFFENFVVEIDYAARTISLYDPKSFVPADGASVLPLEVSNSSLFVKGRARFDGDRVCEGKFLLDTGYNGALFLNSPVVRKYDLVTQERPGYASGVDGVGIGGKVSSRAARVPSLELGRDALSGVTASLSLEPDGVLASSAFKGVVGNDALDRFRVTFDLAGKRLFLERTPAADAPFRSGAHGMRLVPGPSPHAGVAVCGFLNGSSAKAAGVAEGDLIVAVDGKPVVDLDPRAVSEMLQNEGAEVALDLVRGAEKVRVRFTPKQPY